MHTLASKPRRILVSLVLATVLASLPAAAAGPVDGEIGAVYWANNVDAAGFSEDAGGPGVRAQLWLFERYGLKAAMYSSNLDVAGIDDSTYTSVDFLWRVLSPTENNFLALGLGWQQMDLATVGMAEDTSGVRVSVDGRVGLASFVYLYGEVAYLPALSDAVAKASIGGRFEDMEGIELEAGVGFTVAPFLSIRGGYRSQHVEFTETVLGSGEADTRGAFLGLDARF